VAKKRSHGNGSVVKASSGVYQFYWTDTTKKHKRHKKSLRTTDRKKAMELAAEWARVKNLKDTNSVLHESAKLRGIIDTKDLPWDEIWPAFEKTKPSGSEGTLENYKRSVDELVAWCKAQHVNVEGMHQVTPEIASEFMAAVWCRGISANRYNYIRGALSTVVASLKNSHKLENVWAETKRMADPARKRQKRQALTVEQFKDLLAILDDPAKPVRWRDDMGLLIRLGLFAGMREKDAALLKWDDVDPITRKIRYIPHKTRGKAIVADVPMYPEVAGRIMARWDQREADQEYVLPQIAAAYDDGNKAVEKETVRLIHSITGDGKRKRQDGDPQRLRIRSPFGFHSLRHTFCSFMAQSGVSLVKLAAMTGDSPTTLNLYYTHVEGEHSELDKAFTPLLTDGKETGEAERKELHEVIDGLPLAKVRELLALAKADDSTPKQLTT